MRFLLKRNGDFVNHNTATYLHFRKFAAVYYKLEEQIDQIVLFNERDKLFVADDVVITRPGVLDVYLCDELTEAQRVQMIKDIESQSRKERKNEMPTKQKMQDEMKKSYLARKAKQDAKFDYLLPKHF